MGKIESEVLKTERDRETDEPLFVIYLPTFFRPLLINIR